MRNAILPIVVLIASIGQVIAGATISIGAFTGDTYNQLFTLIQPAPYVFSIWGVIYTLAIVYGVYQVIPSNDNEFLRNSRLYALGVFIGSSVWLYVAGSGDATKWLTILILAIVAWMLCKIIFYSPEQKISKKALIFSQKTLFPYAAWTMLATHVNVHSILNQYGLVPGELWNLITGLLLLTSAAIITIWILRRLEGSVWYGLVLVWASVGIIIANYTNIEQGSILVMVGAGLFLLASLFYMYNK